MINKKLVTLAVGAAMGVAPMFAAQADVKVYGQAYAELSRVDNGTTKVTQQSDNNGRGRIGIKFNEKLGNGLSSFGKAEFQMDINDSYSAGGCGAEQTCMRNAYVGLKDGWGSVAAGSFHGAYKTTGGVKYDPFVATSLQARGNGGMAAGRFASNNFVRQIVQYQTPNVNGFSGKLQYSFDSSATSDPNTGTTNGDYLLGGKFKTGPFEVIAAYANNKVNGDKNQKNWKIGGRYKTGPWMATVQYEDVGTGKTLKFNSNTYGGVSNANPNAKAKIWYLNGGYKMGGLNLIAAYGKYNANDNNNFDTTYWALGGIYHFSKRTSVLAGYRSSSLKTETATHKDEKVLAAGLRIDF